MKLPAVFLILAAVSLAGCLSKVPPEKQAGDPWRQRAEQMSAPTAMN